MLELRNVTKAYGSNVVVNHVSLSIGKGEFFCLLGPSGCGKSTILRMIAGFEKATSGTILLNGVDIGDLPPYRRDTNTVFQNYALFPNFNVRDNIAYGLRIKKTPEPETQQRVDEAMALVGLQGLGERMPSQLSGGQQQRVALARAVVNRPSLLLLDEPLSALDKKIAEQTRLELSDLQRRLGISFLYVTHNQIEALTLADRIAVMRSGTVEQCGPPQEIYERPQTRFVADFIGAMNFFEGSVTEVGPKGCKVELAGEGTIALDKKVDQAQGAKVTFCIRPERLRIALLESDVKDYENAIPGVIDHKVYMGDFTQFHIRSKAGKKIYLHYQNYLLFMSQHFYELGEEVLVIWSKSSGEVIPAP